MWHLLTISQNSILPSVTFQKDEDGSAIADVYCCYWNEWKGLVREHIQITFDCDYVISFNKIKEQVLYKYDCGILF